LRRDDDDDDDDDDEKSLRERERRQNAQILSFEKPDDSDDFLRNEDLHTHQRFRGKKEEHERSCE
tara:strand:- start:96 stop:290 length:195 start_codon:yes stop_codon:yes gene_type:complete